MEAVKLAGLEPANVFGFFEKICSIPHGSKNTKAISDYLVDFAQERGLRYIQDEANNVVIFQNGTCGMENHATVILQGHMDMVCEKSPLSSSSKSGWARRSSAIMVARRTKPPRPATKVSARYLLSGKMQLCVSLVWRTTIVFVFLAIDTIMTVVKAMARNIRFMVVRF